MEYLTNKSAPAVRISPTDAHYFFGYYDLQPYNLSQTLHLAHKSSFCNRLPKKTDMAEIGAIDIGTGMFRSFTKTHAWNFQQGAMLQWNPLAPDDEIIYNDFIENNYCGVVMDIHSGKKRFLDRPVANVSKDGKYALSINMSRLFSFRPGYGYANKPDPFFYRNHPENDGIYLTDMKSGTSHLILSLQKIWEFTGGATVFGKDEKILVNHITFNPDGSRFLALVRNFPPNGSMWKTAIITANRDGSDPYLLSHYGVQSHYWWKNEREIFFFSDGKETDVTLGWANTYLLTDKTQKGALIGDGFFVRDNHMSLSPDQSLLITDNYPNETEHRILMLYSPEKNVCANLGYFHSVLYDCIDIRCDLHPRWNRTGDGITFDSTHEGFRGIYRIDLSKNAVEALLTY